MGLDQDCSGLGEWAQIRARIRARGLYSIGRPMGTGLGSHGPRAGTGLGSKPTYVPNVLLISARRYPSGWRRRKICYLVSRSGLCYTQYSTHTGYCKLETTATQYIKNRHLLYCISRHVWDSCILFVYSRRPEGS